MSMSSDLGGPPWAVLLVAGDGDGEATGLTPQAAADVQRVRVGPGAGAGLTLPRAPVVLVSPGCLPLWEAGGLAALRRRYRERCWCALGAAGVVPEGLIPLETPLGVGALRELGSRSGELIARRRTAYRGEARVDELAARLELLTDTIRAAGALLDPGMVSRFIMARAARVLGCARWCVYRVEAGSGQLRLAAWEDPDPDRPGPRPRLPLDRGLAARAAARRDAVSWRIRDASAPPEEWEAAPAQELLALPLVSRGRVIGVAEWADPEPSPIPADRIESARALMDPAALALDNAELFRKLEERTVTDDLTGLHNGRFMDGYLRREVKRAARYGHPVSLLFIDLDGFKLVNDVHGHMAGSRTLVEVGEVLRQNVRDVDVVARWGGDEFGVILPETAAGGAEVMAERLCARIRERRFLGSLGLEVAITASIGVAAFPEHAHDAASLLAAADAAMYHVKYHGKDGAALADEVAEPAGQSG
jgi:diguanylate cyclase (GGDEF)-like protein